MLLIKKNSYKPMTINVVYNSQIKQLIIDKNNTSFCQITALVKSLKLIFFKCY